MVFAWSCQPLNCIPTKLLLISRGPLVVNVLTLLNSHGLWGSLVSLHSYELVFLVSKSLSHVPGAIDSGIRFSWNDSPGLEVEYGTSTVPQILMALSEF
jgi:hypothetical protein